MRRSTATLSTLIASWRYLAFRSGKVRLAAQHAVEWRLRKLLASDWNAAVRAVQRERAQDVVVSLTSWHARLGVLPLTLLTLLRQRLVPSRTIVWLAEDDLRTFCPKLRNGFERAHIEFLPSEDMGPHKKWINCRNLEGDPVIVLADDDIFYPSDWLHALMSEFGQGREYTAHRCHRMKADGDAFAPYGQWDKDVRTYGETSHALFATSGGGVAFRASWIPDAFCCQPLIDELCPRSDDILLNCAMLCAGIKVRRTHYYHPILGPVGASADGLERENVHLDRNTVQMKRTAEYFGITPADALSE